MIIICMNDHNLYNTLTAPKPAEMSPICAAWSVCSLACRLQGLLILFLYNLRAKTCNSVDVCTKGGEPAGLLTDPPHSAGLVSTLWMILCLQSKLFIINPDHCF